MKKSGWRRCLVLFLFSIVALPGRPQGRLLDLLPQPRHVSRADGDFLLAPTFAVRLDGDANPLLERATLRTLRRLEDRTGLRLARSLSQSSSATLVIHVDRAGKAIPQLGEDESYRLSVTSTAIHLEAPTTLGALHGLETIFQLVQPEGTGYGLPAVVIEDAPRFAWRGLMIDCVRHFEPMEVLKRNLDAMAAVKLNVFHWHLTDDQGFRMESKRFPRLTEVGSDGQFYTQEDARELVRYAAARGIRVLPEFEMPGHSTAWLVAYPELSSGPPPTAIRQEFGVSEYVLDPTREATYTFLEIFLTEMSTLFPDRYLHIGGDEAPAPNWKTNPNILAFKHAHGLADNDALQAYFNGRVAGILKRLDRHMVGWDEILNPDLPREIVIQSWRGEESLARAAVLGFPGVLSAPYYLDAMKPASVHYLADPIPGNSSLTPAQQKLILGGEVCMWAEHLEAHTVESRIWPRSAAIAERLWSAQSVADTDDMYRRLDLVSEELEGLGLHHLSSEDAALRELAGNGDASSLQRFAQAFEPVSFSDRYDMQRTDARTPLTSFVDAVVPDPPVRHRLETATRTFLASPGAQNGASSQARTFLLDYFSEVGGAVPAVQALMANSPRLQTLRTRADQLAALARIGKEAILYRAAGTEPPAGWKAAARGQIEAARKPSGLVNFIFLPELSGLVQAVR